MPKKADDGRPDPKDQRALVISIALVEGTKVLATVPQMEFTTGFIKTVAKRHGKLCGHPTGLDCQLLRRAAEYLKGVGKIKGSGLEGMGGS
jgi:hypothetical protein